MKKKNYIILFALFLLTFLSGCEEWLDVRPKSEVKEEDLYKDEAGFRDALLGIYTLMGRTDLYGGNSTMGFLDVLSQTYSNVNDPLTNAVSYDYTNETIKSYIDAMWSKSYNAIANCNYLLKNIEENGNILDEETRKLIKGEALGLRALLHFDILRGFAPSYKAGKELTAVPYVQEVTNSPVRPLSVSETLDLIVADLTEAKNLLKDVDPILQNNYEEEKDYDYEDYINDDGFLLYRTSRLNYYGVTALLARTSLYKEDYPTALSNALEVIESGKFAIANDAIIAEDQSDYLANYTIQNILARHEYISSLYVYNLQEGHSELYFRDSNSASLYINENRKASIFGMEGLDMDMRAKRLFSIPSNSSKEYINKYMAGNQIPLLKLGEMYLIAAEASGDASYLETFRRERGYVNPLPANSSLQDNIQSEYQKEFIAEGQLFYYYKRQNLANIPNTATNMTDRIYIFPQPDDEIEFGYSQN